MKSMTMTIVLLLAAGATGFALRAADPDKAASRVFELRTYTVPEGKMDALHARFRVAHPNKETAEKDWKALAADAEFRAAFAATEKDGKLVDKVESVYLNPADYSPIQ